MRFDLFEEIFWCHILVYDIVKDLQGILCHFEGSLNYINLIQG
jgi:hypothetical protein